jgi:phage terminase large subunit-like protein
LPRLNIKPSRYYLKAASIAAKSAFTGDINPEYERARSDFILFRKLVCAHDTPPHQRAWIEVLNTGQDNRYLRGIAGADTLVLAPRNSAKSTLLIEWVAWVIGIHTAPEHRIPFKVLYVSYEVSTAQQKSQQVQRILESTEYRKVFPHVRPGDNWAKGQWEIDFSFAGIGGVVEPYTLVCAGLKGSATGKRANLICLDDLVKSPEAIANPKIREQMENTWKVAIAPVRFDGTRAICLGTRMTANDIYCTTFIKEKGWKVIEQSAILLDEQGHEHSYWNPESPTAPGMPLDTLRKFREEAPHAFSFQYQNKVVRLDTVAINPDWIKYDRLPDEFERLVIGVDLSAGDREINDYTVFVLGGIAKVDGKYCFYIIDVWRGRAIGNVEKLDALADFYSHWKHLNPYFEVWVETNAYQLSFAGDFQNHLIDEKKLYNLAVVPAPSKGSKLARLRGVTGLFQNGLVKFNHYGNNFPILIQELTEFGSTVHDDACDACVLCLTGLRERHPLSSITTVRDIDLDDVPYLLS